MNNLMINEIIYLVGIVTKSGANSGETNNVHAAIACGLMIAPEGYVAPAPAPATGKPVNGNARFSQAIYSSEVNVKTRKSKF